MEKDYKNEYESGNVIITKDNISDYYKFMSDKDKKENIDLIHFSFNCRLPFNLANDDETLYKDLNSAWNPQCYSNGRMKSQSYFGVKDTLKPIDEYIEKSNNQEEFNYTKNSLKDQLSQDKQKTNSNPQTQ